MCEGRGEMPVREVVEGAQAAAARTGKSGDGTKRARRIVAGLLG
jgi:hypothetical protein